nr:ribonuclease H-like domain-containing protein [Tanacetum cinerariifolium]
EFTSEPAVETLNAKSEDIPKVVKKDNYAPIIEDWKSDDEDESVPQPKIEKKIVKPSVAKGNPQIDLQEKGMIDHGCSRHMTGNMSYLTDYKEIDERYVAFGGNHKGGKITDKGTIKTGELDFENV